MTYNFVLGISVMIFLQLPQLFVVRERIFKQQAYITTLAYNNLDSNLRDKT